jgi:seryl-tRNA synthetase
MEKKLDDCLHELSDLQKDKEHLLEEIERLRRQKNQMTIIYQEKDALLESMSGIKEEKDLLQARLKQLELEIQSAKLQMN